MKKIAEFLDKVRQRFGKNPIDFDIRDAHAYGGLIMFGYGMYQMSPSAAWAISGLFIFWLGVRR